MKKVIVYGIGKIFTRDSEKIKKQFSIIGYSDTKEKNIEGYIPPKYISKYDFDYIYITTDMYFEEIKKELIKKYSIDENKIIGRRDMWWYVDNSKNRDEWIKKHILDIEKGKILLDAGAGEQRWKSWCKHLQYISQDFGEYDGIEKTEGLQFEKWDTSKVDITSDIIDIPLEKESVDAILCTEVLEHLKNPVLAIKEFSRLLKPEGKLILTAPFCSLTHMAPFYFSNGFSKYWYEENLKEYGFLIKEIVPNGNYYTYLQQEILRIEEMAKKYSKLELDSKDINDIVEPMAKLLKKLQENDLKSSEVLCFGWMVLAEKKFEIMK